MKKIRILFYLLGMFLLFGCKKDSTYQTLLKDPELFRSAVKKLTDVIVYDIFSPPVAARVYAYPTIAAYAIVQKENKNNYKGLQGQLKDFPSIPEPQNEKVNVTLASLHAFLVVGRELIFSEERITAFQSETYEMLRENGLPKSELKASQEYGDQVAKIILDWADKDLYKQTRTYPKYTILEGDKFWKPTPPDYMDGIEPHWNRIRTMVLDSADQFVPKPPLEFDLAEGTPFKNQLLQVYAEGNGSNAEKKEIASFWDCNPYVSHHMGHAMFATKKITPGGHWIGITQIATKKSGSNYIETVNAYTRVSIALFDAFISCWDEKWRSLVVRPETLINQYIDEEWVPLLQTPPFPEYTSGHSVISRAAAIALTEIFGDHFAFDDTTEVEYGLPVRSFDSFIEASEEAAISRLYGGIHYWMAIEEGVAQGDNVGNFIAKKLTTLIDSQSMTASAIQ